MSTHHKRLLVAPLCVVVPYLLFLHHKKQSRFNRDDYINDGNNDYFREDDETMKFQASRSSSSSSSSSKLKAVQAQKADKKKTLSMPSTATTTTTYPSSVDDNSVPFFPWEPQLNQFQKNMNDENRVEKVIMKFESATRSKESNDKDNHSQTSNQLEFISSMTFATGNLRKPSCPCCQ